jgi:hypothetical protein
MERFHRQRHQIYKENDFEIQSLNSLVKTAIEKTRERMDTSIPDESVEMPIHNIPERLMQGLQQMHHHLQNLLMQKLGYDAHNVIIAERSRQTSVEKERLDERLKKLEEGKKEAYFVGHLSEIGQAHGADELE